MARDTSFDTMTYDLIQAYVAVFAPLSGLGQVNNTGAVYGHLILPMPQEPFPAIYVYLGGIKPDYSQGSSIRKDVTTITARVIGGPVTPTYKVNPEDAIYRLATAILNELDYRPYLQNPTTGDPLRYLVEGVKVQPVGRAQAFDYSEQGKYAGLEISSIASLQYNVGRVS